MISLIVAVDKNGCIGLNGKMPWNLPEELKHFRNYTLNKKILVGRKTYDGFNKPLSQRFHYILSTNLIVDHPNVKVIHELDELINKYKNNDEELVVIGGSQIYELMLEHVDKMIISVIKNKYNGDTYFPKFNINEFKTISKDEYQDFDVYTLIRKEN